mmetsp:Transcript_38836/g.88318  ORF Transcript_38836/g.88318 Transcript_38836/m.88318 type:complete len:138 (-) Transcript_38836:91-504(-)
MSLFISVQVVGTGKWYKYDVSESFTIRDLKAQVFKDTGIPIEDQRICADTATEQGCSFKPDSRKALDSTGLPEGFEFPGGVCVLRKGEKDGPDMTVLDDAFEVVKCASRREIEPPKPKRDAAGCGCGTDVAAYCSVM